MFKMLKLHEKERLPTLHPICTILNNTFSGTFEWQNTNKKVLIYLEVLYYFFNRKQNCRSNGEGWEDSYYFNNSLS